MELNGIYKYLRTSAALLDKTLVKIVHKNCVQLYKTALKNKDETIANNLDAMYYSELYAAARSSEPEIMQPLMQRRAYEIYSKLKQNNEFNQIEKLIKRYPYQLLVGAQRARDAACAKLILDFYAYEMYKTARDTENYTTMSNAAAQAHTQIYVTALAKNDQDILESILSGYAYDIYKQLSGTNNEKALKYLEDNYAVDIFNIANRRLDSKTVNLLVSKKTYQIFINLMNTDNMMAGRIAREYHTKLYLDAKTTGNCAAIQTVIDLHAHTIYSDLIKIGNETVANEFKEQYFIQIYETAVANGAINIRDDILSAYGYKIYLCLVSKAGTDANIALGHCSSEFWGQVYLDAKKARNTRIIGTLSRAHAYDIFMGLRALGQPDLADDFRKKYFILIYLWAIERRDKSIQHETLSLYPYQIYSFAINEKLESVARTIEQAAGPLCYDIYKSAIKANDQAAIKQITRYKNEIEKAALSHGDVDILRTIRTRFQSSLNIAAIGKEKHLAHKMRTTEYNTIIQNEKHSDSVAGHWQKNLDEYLRWLETTESAPGQSDDAFHNNWD